MQIDKNKFFREATLRICGSIEIEKALFGCFNYLKKYIKIDRIYLHYIKLKEKTGTVLAMADHKEGKQLDIRFDYPSPIWIFIGDGRSMPEEMLLNRADLHPLGKQMLRIVGINSKESVMILRLIIDGKEVGVVGFGAKGWDRFRKEDLDLVRLLRAPFAIALSNSRRYRELLQLKNLLADDNKYLLNELRFQKSEEIVGAEFGLCQVMQQVHQVAPLPSPVLLLGETGVGKEVIANAIHNLSPRRAGPFIKINCGAIPETLIDSELFGHEKGAFTGAVEKRRGRFERAHNGTIFLDEIGELPHAAQLRLLRVLQEMEFEPVGATKAIKVDIRIIAATNRNIEVLIEEERFRKDLYFRLMVFPIHIPALRERKCDIPALVQHFILKKYRQMGFEDYPALEKGAIKKLKSYSWPGNVRELENTVEKEMIINRETPLRFDGVEGVKPEKKTEWNDFTDSTTLLLDEIVSGHIQKVLKRTKGKVGGEGGAAELMGIHQATLRHKMRKLGVPFGRDVTY
ncbi:MAG: sigma 54-interacting transcriptional regulator [Deltaproteobacteria bacterium]|nr:sigma 54-interacting transcriptional regulator [Deltaproteobacteria bacterium]